MTEKTARTGIGIIADRTLLRQRLRQTLEEKGFTVVANIPPEGCSASLLESPVVRVWLVDLENEDGYDELFEQLVDIPRVPVFYDIGLPQLPSAGSSAEENKLRWERRLINKLNAYRDPATAEYQGDSSVVTWPIKLPQKRQTTRSGKPAERVWVIGASLGGPNAVKQFLDALPEDLPVAFVYAQHIDREFVSTLASTIARHSYLNVVAANPGLVLEEGDILLTPVDYKIYFDDKYRLHCLDEGWSGSYCPNIDEVMEAVRRAWPQTCGAIIFSGMGIDGSYEARSYRDQNCPVWIQTPETCASSLMPDSIIEAGCDDWRGTPEELAAHLVKSMKNSQENKSHGRQHSTVSGYAGPSHW
ncbi:chemotaxis protein CheB [Sansalvadorimonas verongulae]|uniref:chemotaxis protein CheB n=1 Tax=Sansalvadorimonas verongulae TaxID=2172824 RepID=UPI0012BBD47E|nr:chemotaxis protein CheB [Sansalvadorimonas verongulae]MTI14981.1 hypothetical protein [Sansalvadorimonas verongulae]